MLFSKFATFSILTILGTARMFRFTASRRINCSVCSHCLRFQSNCSVSATGGREVRILLCSKIRCCRWGSLSTHWPYSPEYASRPRNPPCHWPISQPTTLKIWGTNTPARFHPKHPNAEKVGRHPQTLQACWPEFTHLQAYSILYLEIYH